MANGRDEYDQIVRGLHEQLKALREAQDQTPLVDARSNVTPTRNRLRSSMPVWGVAGLFVAAMAGIYSLYNMALNERITDVLRVLDQLPK
jgi:type VI secretion system protein ImpK